MQNTRTSNGHHAQQLQPALARLIQNVRQAVVIDPTKLELIVVALLAKGHVLLEDVPGIGKTLVAKAIAGSLHGTFRRVQCTPDLLPSDITGGAIYNQREGRFDFVPGPIFGNIVLVDEINRASPRTQSSLLESMAEGQVTVDGVTHALPQPFCLMATQNPIEMAGTFPLPEAQLDRFLLMLGLGYPDFADEVSILEREAHADPLAALTPVLSLEDVVALQASARAVEVARSLKEYIVSVTSATRAHADVVVGVSPRGGVALQKCAQAMALMRGRAFVTPDDIKTVAPAVLVHRLLTRDRRPATAQAVIADLLTATRVPVE
ncbi:MAG: MoxR family ATPase [Armatimonadetes bacterium]|nr:MoxR family ATPase [Anaerolineae bacterium]